MYEVVQVGTGLRSGRAGRFDALDKTTQCRLATWKWFLALNALAQFGYQLLCSRGIDTWGSKFDALYTHQDATDRTLRIAQEGILKVAGSVRWIELCFARRVKRDGTQAARYRRVNEQLLSVAPYCRHLILTAPVETCIAVQHGQIYGHPCDVVMACRGRARL